MKVVIQMNKHFDKDKKTSKQKIIIKWFSDHFIFIWVVSSLAFAFVIHCLFSTPAPNEWIKAKWGAGDILTFVSTVALGLLAVWQNKRFQEENDEAQIRMEKLTREANELSIINKVVEHENNSIERLRTKKTVFIGSCDTESAVMDISDVAQQPQDFMKTYLKIKMDNRIKQIRLTAIELLSELNTYQNEPSVIELINIISDYSKYSIELMRCIRVNSAQEDIYNKKTEKEKEFITSISNFITEREKLLKQVIYGKLSFDDIRTLYHGKV